MLEQIVETRLWKAARRLVQDGHCRVCHERNETIDHIVAGCKVLANSEYLSRRYGLVQRTVGRRNGDGKLKRETRVGFRIPSTKKHNGKKT